MPMIWKSVKHLSWRGWQIRTEDIGWFWMYLFIQQTFMNWVHRVYNPVVLNTIEPTTVDKTLPSPWSKLQAIWVKCVSGELETNGDREDLWKLPTTLLQWAHDQIMLPTNKHFYVRVFKPIFPTFSQLGEPEEFFTRAPTCNWQHYLRLSVSI